MTKNKQGSEALAASSLVGFEPADNSVYAGYSELLSAYTRYAR